MVFQNCEGQKSTECTLHFSKGERMVNGLILRAMIAFAGRVLLLYFAGCVFTPTCSSTHVPGGFFHKPPAPGAHAKMA
jgi:peroxiredoxin